MNLKTTLCVAACCLMGFNAFAHRDIFYDHGFSEALDDGWTLSGGAGEGADGMFIVTGDGSGSITFTKTFDTPLAIPNFESVTASLINTGTENVVVKVELTGEDGSKATLTGPVLPDNGELKTDAVVGTEKVEGKIPASVKTLNIVLAGSDATTTCVLSNVLVKSIWNYPTIRANSSVTIEAEDFDEGELGQTYGTQITQNKNRYRKSTPFVDVPAKESFYSNGYAIGNNGENWDKYVLNKPLTVETAKENWGQWYQYTIKVEDNCEANITVMAGCHLGSYQLISVLGNHSSMNIPFEDLGHPFNWVAQYSGAWVLSLDGKNLQTTQTKRIVYGGGGEDVYGPIYMDKDQWISTQIVKDGQTVNNDTTWIYPNLENAQKSYNSWAPMTQAQPHYMKVNLTKGTHVLKFQSLAPQFTFDCMKVETGNAGVDAVSTEAEQKALKVFPNPATDVVSFGEEVEYTVFDLRSGKQVLKGSGTTADVSNIAVGTYAVRTADGRVAKLIKM